MDASTALLAPDGRLTAIVVGYLLSPEEAFVYAKMLPDNQILQLLSKNIAPMHAACEVARIGWSIGLNAVLHWAEKFHERVDVNRVLALAARGGHSKTMRVAKEWDASDFGTAFENAASGGHVSAMKLARSWGVVTNYYYALCCAAGGGHIDAMKLVKVWGKVRGVDNFNWALCYAAGNGHIEAIVLLISWGANNLNDGLESAAHSGHIPAMELFRSLGANHFDIALINASRGGHTSAMKQLKE